MLQLLLAVIKVLRSKMDLALTAHNFRVRVIQEEASEAIVQSLEYEVEKLFSNGTGERKMNEG